MFIPVRESVYCLLTATFPFTSYASMREGYLSLFTNIFYFEISVPVNNDYRTSWRLWSRQWFVVPLAQYRDFPEINTS